MDSDPVISVYPTETSAAPGQEVRFQFMTVGDETVAYEVQCADAAVGSWIRVLLPTVRAGPGELVVDVPADARVGPYALRLVATEGGRELAAAALTLRIEGERCLRIVSVPKVSLQADGTVLVTLRVVNCGIVDANVLLRVRHEDGWSFSVDSPELIIGVGEGPVTVKVTLRPPTGRKVDRGDRITVEVETGTGWQPLPGRVQRLVWPWVAAAAVVATATAGALSALGPEADDDVRVNDGRETTVTTDGGTQTTGTTVGSTAQPLRVVPDVVGETEGTATAILEDAGFVVATEPVDAQGSRAGIVMEQSPSALTEAPVGTTVTLGVSVGPDLVTVPVVDGLSEEEARRILESEGFEITSVIEEESADQLGTVIRSDPTGGSRVPATSAGVALIMSSGPPPSDVE